MADVFDKFNDWLRAVCVQPDLTGSDKLVLSYIAVFYVRQGEDTFCVRQSTIAERCAISRKSVNAAIGRAKQLGFLAVARQRDRGTGRNRADELRIVLPEWSNELSHHSTELSDQSLHHSRDSSENLASGQRQSDVTNSAELCNQSGPSDVTKTTELCNRANASASGNNTPTGLDTGLTTGFEGRVYARDAHDGEVIDAEIVADEPARIRNAPSGVDVFDVFGLGAANPVGALSDPRPRPTGRRADCQRCGGTGEYTDERGYLFTNCPHTERTESRW